MPRNVLHYIHVAINTEGRDVAEKSNKLRDSTLDSPQKSLRSGLES
jgi:hypothetical protein